MKTNTVTVTRVMIEKKEVYKKILIHLKNAAKERGITYEMIAEKTGFTTTNISRMLSARYDIKLSTYIVLCEAIGYNVILEKIQ